jgi:hypothetical protein
VYACSDFQFHIMFLSPNSNVQDEVDEDASNGARQDAKSSTSSLHRYAPDTADQQCITLSSYPLIFIWQMPCIKVYMDGGFRGRAKIPSRESMNG